MEKEDNKKNTINDISLCAVIQMLSMLQCKISNIYAVKGVRRQDYRIYIPTSIFQAWFTCMWYVLLLQWMHYPCKNTWYSMSSNSVTICNFYYLMLHWITICIQMRSRAIPFWLIPYIPLFLKYSVLKEKKKCKKPIRSIFLAFIVL